MPGQTYVFFDLDDTLLDYAVCREQFQRELTRHLAAGFGGNSSEWEAAIAVAIPASIGRYLERFGGNPLAGFNAWLPGEQGRVAEEIFERVGKPFPADVPAAEYAARIQFTALAECSAPFPNADSTLKALYD